VSEGYRMATRLFSAIIIAFGVAIVVVTLARGGGAGAFGVVFGLLFIGLGAGRLYLATRE
jgi:hypothetical protein